MVRKSKQEYLQAIQARYREAGRAYKKKILDEFCLSCHYHRKHAIRLLNPRAKAPRQRSLHLLACVEKSKRRAYFVKPPPPLGED